MNQRHPFLLTLFLRLRQRGFTHLCVNDYQQVIETLSHEAFNFNDLEGLALLCKLLWVKSPEQELLFNHCFTQITSAASVLKFSESSSQKVPLLEDKPSPEKIADSPESLQGLPENQPSQEPPAAASFGESRVAIAVKTEKAKKDYQDLEQKPQKKRREKIDYLPPSFQQIFQGWQSLRTFFNQGSLSEIDLDKTLDNIQRQGYFFDIEMKTCRRRTTILLLLDQSKTMVPFFPYSRQLQEAATFGGQLSQVQCYYFRNVPNQRLFLDPNWRQSISIQQILSNLNPEKTDILVFSDAGAAVRGLDWIRLRETQDFLSQVESYCRTLVWLNPVPKTYWQKRTAEKLAKSVKMLEFSQEGWQTLIKIL